MLLLNSYVVFFLITKCESIKLEDYCKFDAENTPCYYKCERAARCGTTPEDYKIFVDDERNWATSEHNRLRNKVAEGAYASKGLPAASNMMAMSYDKEAEFMAGCYIKQCIFEHDKVRKDLEGNNMGQNLYTSWTTATRVLDNAFITKGIMAWFNEVDLIKDKSEGQGYITNFKMIKVTGHLTQMLWHDTLYVGCATMHSVISAGKNTYDLYCDYRPPGNKRGKQMYTAGAMQCTKNSDFPFLCGNIRPLELDTYISPLDLSSTFTFAPKKRIIILMCIILYFHWTM